MNLSTEASYSSEEEAKEVKKQVTPMVNTIVLETKPSCRKGTFT